MDEAFAQLGPHHTAIKYYVRGKGTGNLLKNFPQLSRPMGRESWGMPTLTQFSLHSLGGRVISFAKASYYFGYPSKSEIAPIFFELMPSSYQFDTPGTPE